MKKFLRITADILLGFVAILGIINYLPLKIEKIDLLAISIVVLFILFITLMIKHISGLERKINIIEQKFIREKDLSKIKVDIQALKLNLQTKK